MLAPHADASGRAWTTEDIDLVERLACCEARESFWAYRQFMNPGLIVNWWTKEIAIEMHRLWLEYRAGRRPKVLLQSPPQHGKSTTVIDFLSWVVGHDRDLQIIFSSFSDRLGVRANLRLQRIFSNPKWTKVFGEPILGSGRQQNSQALEFAGGEGIFRNTTVLGSVTGETLDLGVLDDPLKGRAEANSKTIRDKVWDWMTDDFLPRFADKGAMLMIMTRYHLDDPAGRLIEHYPGVRVLRYPALAERDERHRCEGEPLVPELKTLEFLRKQRDVMTLAGWQSQYQQTPIVVGGEQFPIDKVVVVPEPPAAASVVSVARYWDKAGTTEGGAYSAGVLMLRMRDGTYTVADVRRGQWSALDRERVIQQTAAVDRELYPTTKIYVEQEPGSGGKESAEASVRMLAGYNAAADRVSGSKEVRADPFAAQWQAGNVRIVAAPWNRSYLDEHEHFPAGKYKDQVDASSGAFNKIASKYRYDSSMSWVS